jgi:hypothetical protein
MKYESPITYHSNGMANVEVFAKRQTEKQTDGQAKNYTRVCPRSFDTGK